MRTAFEGKRIVAAANRDFQCLGTFPAWFESLMSFPQASCVGAARPEQLAPLVVLTALALTNCSCFYSLASQDECIAHRAFITLNATVPSNKFVKWS